MRYMPEPGARAVNQTNIVLISFNLQSSKERNIKKSFFLIIVTSNAGGKQIKRKENRLKGDPT